MNAINLQMIGRFGNQCMQYLHARALAERDGLELRTPRWIGEKVFQIEPTAEPDYSGAYLHGYFQNQESLIYSQAQVCEWFKFRSEIEAMLASLRGIELVGHQRHGDYEGYNYPIIALQSYYNACLKFGFTKEIICFVLEESPTLVCGLPAELQFVADFFVMANAKVLFRANSTFSWVAGALNPNKVFSPRIDGLSGGPQLVNFEYGNHCKLVDLEGFTDLHLK